MGPELQLRAVTTNANSWGTASKFPQETSAHVVLVQEHRLGEPGDIATKSQICLILGSSGYLGARFTRRRRRCEFWSVGWCT
eukprot:8306093-Pyramimonas_sp.AAC.1